MGEYGGRGWGSTDRFLCVWNLNIWSAIIIRTFDVACGMLLRNKVFGDVSVYHVYPWFLLI